MKFVLVDRIESIVPGERIVTKKSLSLAEEYLADHFPDFPVLPGVMMIEAAVQAAAWLVRIEQDYANSIVVLSSARNVKYTSFVKPGNSLRCEIDVMKISEDTSKFKVACFVNSTPTMSGRLELRSFNLVDREKSLAPSDKTIVDHLKKQFVLVGGPAAMSKVAGG